MQGEAVAELADGREGLDLVDERVDQLRGRLRIEYAHQFPVEQVRDGAKLEQASRLWIELHQHQIGILRLGPGQPRQDLLQRRRGFAGHAARSCHCLATILTAFARLDGTPLVKARSVSAT